MKAKISALVSRSSALLLALALPLVAAPPLRILPLGDSITFGSGAAGGYRGPLYQLLTNAGYNVDFIGTQTGNGVATLPDSDHEGHGGWRIDQIDALFPGNFYLMSDPDIILVLIGTNDYGQGYDTPNATNRLEALIAKLATNRPHAKIVVASLTVRGEPLNSQIQATFNPAVPQIVARQAALGRQVYFTDLYNAVPLADMPDNLHPNLTGYTKMATNWFTAITNHFTPEGSTNAPALSHVYGQPNLTNLLVTFSKPVADNATNLANYSVDGGLTLQSAALDQTSLRDVSFVTSRQTPGFQYTLTVTGVTDRTAALTPIAAGSAQAFYAIARGAVTNVPEATNYALVYSLNIPNTPSFGAQVPYDVDLHAYYSNFTRVAYYLELQPTNGTPIYAWVSMDPPTNNVTAIGVPNTGSGATLRQSVSNMTVICNMPGVVNGTGLTGGYLEFWPINYNQTNSANVAGASSTAYDFGDNPSAGNYGSMQIHNTNDQQVIIAFNRWGGTGGTADLGIGNRPGSLDIDWTFAQNASTYTVKTLQVYVIPTDNSNPPQLVNAASQAGGSNIVLSFSKPLDDGATNILHYQLDGGLTVLGAELDPVTLLKVTLTTTPLTPNSTYTVTINDVRERYGSHLPVAPNTSATFKSAAASGIFGNVNEAADYQLVYSLNIPNAASYNNTGVPYDLDLHTRVGAFTRIGYYLELQPAGGAVDFIWITMDPFTPDTAKIGVPSAGTGALFQQPVANLSAYSSVSSIIPLTNAIGGYLEFWYWNYQQTNAANVPGASSATFDWGDRVIPGTLGYGSMQIHNTNGQQVLMAFNNWGGTGGGNNCLGIGNNTSTVDPDWTHVKNAGNYAVKRLQVFVLPATNEPPVLVQATGQPGRTNIVLTFSKPLADDSSDLAHYTLSGGLTIAGAALDPATKTSVTLTTGPQAPGTLYTVTASGLRDRTRDSLALAAGASATFMAEPVRGVFNNVAEAAGYRMVYSLDLPVSTANYNITGVPYNVDAHHAVGAFSRIAYYLELQKTGGRLEFLWTSLDPFTDDAGKLGIPTFASRAFFQQPVSNLTVYGSQPGLVMGTNLPGGFIEFWPVGQATTNAASVPGASSAVFDWGDTPAAANFGVMQLHNPGAGQVLFAFNNWGAATAPDLGIGNNSLNTNADWTAMANAGAYTVKTIQVFVLPVTDTTPPTVIQAVASLDREHILITFSEPLADSAAALGSFAISNLTVSGAVLSNNLRQVILTTAFQSAGTVYTLSVSGVRDRSEAGNLMLPAPAITVSTPGVPAQILANVPETSTFQLACLLTIPAVSPGWNANGTAYAVDNRNALGLFNRVAYYLELATNNGPTNWIYVSMDPFTTNLNRIGVPDMTTGARFQQAVGNLNVYSSVPGISTGFGLAGNIEFWPFDYSAANAVGVPNASASLYDWGDTYTPTFGINGYGSMQIHNSAASQVLLVYDAWGTARISEVGIGNSTGAQPDYTFANNAVNYTTRNLYVLVQPLLDDAEGPLIVRATGLPDRTHVLLTFNEPINPEWFSGLATFGGNNGLTVTAAQLQPNPREVLVTTTPQTPGAAYLLTVNGVMDRASSPNFMAADSTITFIAVPDLPFAARVPDSTNYVLVQKLALPGAVPNYNLNGINYDVDLRPFIPLPFDRIAYHLELATNGGATNWVHVSANAFTTNINRLGVPALGTGGAYQHRLTNMNVASSQANITAGTSLSTGNIEFWPLNYSAPTNSGIPTGSNTTLDHNDTYSTGGQYGAMQIHNYGANQVLFAFNRWGGGQSGSVDIGIGNAPGWTHPDWTFTNNGPQYVLKNLYVLVRPSSAPVPVVNPPAIVAQPRSRLLPAGGTLDLYGEASGAGQITYQWRWNGATLTGQTNAWLTLAPAQAGNYDLVAANAGGSVTSLVAVVTLETVVPAQLSAFEFTAGGMRFQFSGNPGATGIVERALQVTGPWTNIATIVAPSAFTDTNTPPVRGFYRARLP